MTRSSPTPVNPYITGLKTKAAAVATGLMHPFRTDERAVSEVVGSLMLILIVFAAASSLALFVQAEQREYQAQERFEQDRLLEKLAIQKVDPALNTTTGDTWETLNFTLTSLHVNPSYLATLHLNGQPLETWNLWRFNATSGKTELQVHERPDEVRIDARERFAVQVNLTSDGYTMLNVATSDKVELEIGTWLGNRFAHAFLPPAAVAFVETESVWNGTAYETVLVLDGSRSTALNDASLVSWAWTVQPDGLVLNGQKARADLMELSSDHTVTLEVTDSFGMVDSIEFRYHY